MISIQSIHCFYTIVKKNHLPIVQVKQVNSIKTKTKKPINKRPKGVNRRLHTVLSEKLVVVLYGHLSKKNSNDIEITR